MSETVLTETNGNWVEITLNRPARLNAFNEDMHIALRAALENAAAGGARAILLTGAGRAFCAGQDLGARDPAKMTALPDLSETLRAHYNPLVTLMRGLGCPLVCAVNGVAAGAGANIALAADIVLAAHSASFIQSFANVGLVPDAGGSWLLTRLLGEARAKGLAMTATPLPAETAEAWGLIWKAVPDGALMAEARRLTEQLANGPTFGLSQTKKLIEAAGEQTFEAQLELEARAQKACGESPDYAEGVRAFLEKRPPRFSGKAR